jgi:P pilus assembly chaperone PapD
MLRKTIFGLIGASVSAAALTAPAHGAGGGDLLVAPTRLVMDGRRGTEVVLNNIGSEPATYRVSLELRRMNAEGKLDTVETPSPAEAAALDMIAYAPRKVTLQPNQPQSIRVGVRPPDGLLDGEYRVHMLFRAIPEAQPASAAQPATENLSIALTPIYGITIPVIVRTGELAAQAAISDAKVVTTGSQRSVSFELARTGTRSLYGDVKLARPGAETIVLARGIAVYPEIARRNVTLPLEAGATGGSAILQYVERPEDGGRVLAETPLALR